MKKGIEQLNCHPHIWVIEKSYVYQSTAMYQTDQEDFYNVVVEIESNFNPNPIQIQLKSESKPNTNH